MFTYYNNPTPKTRTELYKKWTNIQIILSNITVWLDIPTDATFNRVHENNMTKIVDGKLHIHEDDKILKPENYVKPDMSNLWT